MVICIYAFVSAKDFKEYEKLMQDLTKVLMLEGGEGNQLLHKGDETERRQENSR